MILKRKIKLNNIAELIYFHLKILIILIRKVIQICIYKQMTIYYKQVKELKQMMMASMPILINATWRWNRKFLRVQRQLLIKLIKNYVVGLFQLKMNKLMIIKRQPLKCLLMVKKKKTIQKKIKTKI